MWRMAPLQAYLTTAQAAKRLDVSMQTVRRWARDGLIEVVVLPSGRRRFDVAEIERLLEPTKAAS